MRGGVLFEKVTNSAGNKEEIMTFTEKLLAAALGGLVLWASKNIISFFVYQYRIKKSLLIDIKIYQYDIRNTFNYVNNLFSKEVLKAGNILIFPVDYYKEEFNYYRSIRSDIHRHFGKMKLTRITKFYDTLWEFECIMAGFFKAYNFLVEKEKILAENHIRNFEKLRGRLEALTNLITKDIKELNDLPLDYQDKEPPRVIKDQFSTQ